MDMATALNVTIKRTSLTDAVYETLLESIISGRLALGTELSTVALAGQLDVSRTPVTEALRRLENDGLVNQLTNNRVRVAIFSRNDVVEIYEVRKHLEAASAEAAALSLSEAQLAELRQATNNLATTRKKVDWSARAIEFDISFHDTLAAATGNRRLRQDIGRYRLLVRSFCRLTGDTTNLDAAFREHLVILESLEARKPAAARKAMITHIENRLATVLQQLTPKAD
jgi:DNA-binding GntR family transcriptional regulator